MTEMMKTEGLTRCELAAGSHPDLTLYECTLKAGCRYEPELLGLDDRMQMFFFVNATGYVATKNRAWNIKEQAIFIPNYKKEKFWIEAGEKDLKFVHIIGVMNAYDEKEYIDYHIILPNMRGKSECFRFTEYYTGKLGSTIESRRLVLDTAFGRWFVGMNDGEGQSAFVGEHTQEHLQQWNYVLPGSHFKYPVNGEEHEAKDGDVIFVPKGASFSAKPVGEAGIHYLWIKFASEGFPVGRDGYPGSEE